MSCKKCRKKKCTCVSSCDTECLGCVQTYSTDCVYIPAKLDCINKPKGTDLTEILEEICTLYTELETRVDTVESIDASDVMVSSLSCIQESNLSGTDLQSVLEDICIAIDSINDTIENISATDIRATIPDCLNESEVDAETDLQSILDDLCTVLTDLADGIVDPDADWFVSGTTDVPTSITDNIYTQGKVSIGKATAGTVLDVVGDLSVVYNNLKAYIGAAAAISIPILSENYEYLFGLVNSNNSSVLVGNQDYLYIGKSTGTGTARIIFTDANPTALITSSDNVSVSSSIFLDKDAISIRADNANIAQFDKSSTATHTRFLIYDVDTGSIQRVSVGANDSGGGGFKVLRIPN